MTGAEERLAATVDRMNREISRLGRAQQAQFAFMDSLAKILLTCIAVLTSAAELRACDALRTNSPVRLRRLHMAVRRREP